MNGRERRKEMKNRRNLGWGREKGIKEKEEKKYKKMKKMKIIGREKREKT